MISRLIQAFHSVNSNVCLNRRYETSVWMSTRIFLKAPP
ncbi:protein of unknown function [Methylococcus capsulatus]|uniref:Uncharacterized protein n=1 Tax=Methylococcus capsulatus TaxID=414 RepID=A0AA35V2N2_METCP|nr:protein of unknown function [Methylococcus capsulatus]